MVKKKWLLIIGLSSVALTIGLIVAVQNPWKHDQMLDGLFDSLKQSSSFKQPRIPVHKIGPSSPIPAGDVGVAMERLAESGEQVEPGFWLTTGGWGKNANTYQAFEDLAGKVDVEPLRKFSWAVLSEGNGLDRINQPSVEYAAVLTKLEATDFECTLYARWWSNEDSLAGYVEPVVSSENDRIGLQVVSVNCYRQLEQIHKGPSVRIHIQLRVVYRGGLLHPSRDTSVPVAIEIVSGK